ncbi:MAG: glycoside hydrolase family 127 protein [Chloroflexi bacterium]|nr:glycoside hydrolase family 127 protein [Chloroflexota bacterium]
MSSSPKITSGFWRTRLDLNAATAIFYQWEQLEASRCIDNFRIAAGQIDGFREGYYFADSDAYKWLEAAARILDETPDPRLKALVDDLIGLLDAVQQPDGYINTYNQIHFPGQRWVNLQIEHEFYCLGHLIEAGVAHHTATGETRLLTLVRRTADLLVRDFMEAPAAQTDGHEEIELALIRLYRHTAEPAYLELARRLLERRGRIPDFPLLYWRQSTSAADRKRTIAAQRVAYLRAHPEDADFKLPGDNPSKRPPFAGIRRKLDHYSGKYFQQNLPIRQQTNAVGHSVRFGYLETAAAMLARETGDDSLRAALETVWLNMVTRRMYVTGGLGALPFTEGFGRDYELDPEYAYAETCAALASLFWGDEMARLTRRPRYADLFEWQLYNAASVGIASDGKSYFYNNPLTCRGGLTRAGWYVVPCCPSNLSRTWASLGQTIFDADESSLWINQYISSQTSTWNLRMESQLPWGNTVKLTFDQPSEKPASLHLRIPSWAEAFSLMLNGQPLQPETVSSAESAPESASGYNPCAARSISISQDWRATNELTLQFEMPIRLLRQDKRLPGCGGMLAVSRGPLVYCLESVDNPGLDIFAVSLDPASLQPIHDETLLGGIVKITGKTQTGQPLTLIPYMLWGNRGPATMTVFVRD